MRELLRALAAARRPARYRCYARTRWEEPLDARFEWREIGAGDPWWHLRAARAAQRECDVFLSSNSYLTPLFMRTPAVPIVYDLVTFEPRDATQPPLGGHRAPHARRVHAARGGGHRDLSGDRRRARGALPAAAARTTVALLGTSPALESAGARGAASRAGLRARRRHARAAQEPAAVGRRLRELDAATQSRHPLVVVGALGWETGETLAALRALGDRAILLGHVSDAALAELYRRCAVFCYPSLGEGFGLPVLEAMAAGAAVLTAANSSLPEVGGDAVEYVDASDAASIAAGLERLLESPARRAELGALALERAREFSWAGFAERTLAVLGHAAPVNRSQCEPERLRASAPSTSA